MPKTFPLRAILSLSLALIVGSVLPAAAYDVVEKDITTLQADMAAGRVTSVQLVQAYLARIAILDRAGPALHSVLALNPDALAIAAKLDAERKAKGPRGPLHGIPILVKDNIETADPIPTTAGSLALANNITHRDAPVVARLRAAGAIILGKTNLSEWANIRSSYSMSGWSGIGGLTHNPYVLDRTTCGSSSGSGAAVSASLAAAALGTETNGSLVCPGSRNGIVSLKPTMGLVSRTHIIPISQTQDTAGPMARSVRDAALLLGAMAGSDAADAVTADSDAHKTNYAAALTTASLTGKRLGVIVPAGSPRMQSVYAAAIAALRAAGADVVEIPDLVHPDGLAAREDTVIHTELKGDMALYLASLPPALNEPKTLADLIAFNKTSPREMAAFGQDIFELSDLSGPLSDPAYIQARTEMQASVRALLDKTFADNRLDALVEPTNDVAFRVDSVTGDYHGGTSAASLPAMAGRPHLTVPMGFVGGLPVGLSFIGPAWSEAKLLALGAAFEKALPARRAPQFIPSLEPIAAALQPLHAP